MYRNMSSELSVAFNWSQTWFAHLQGEERCAISFCDDNAGDRWYCSDVSDVIAA